MSVDTLSSSFSPERQNQTTNFLTEADIPVEAPYFHDTPERTPAEAAAVVASAEQVVRDEYSRIQQEAAPEVPAHPELSMTTEQLCRQIVMHGPPIRQHRNIALEYASHKEK